MERDATTASSLEVEQDSGNINTTQSMAILNKPLPQGTSLGSGPSLCFVCETILVYIKGKKVNGQEQIHAIVDKQKGEAGNVTSLFETMMINAQEKVGEEANIAQAKEIAKSKKRVKKLEKRKKSIPTRLRRLKKGKSIEEIDQDAEIALVDEAQGRMHDAYMFGVDDLEGNEVIVDVREKTVEKEVSTGHPVTTAGEVVTPANVEDSATPTTATTTDVDDELTLEKTLITIKAAKPKVISIAMITPKTKGIVYHEQVQAHIPTISYSKDKGKAKMIEPKKPLKKKDQIALNEEVARKLEAKIRDEIEEEERIAREKDKASKAVVEEWDDV
nr:hypothetical protein [Tanacetum cinerariifolium]